MRGAVMLATVLVATRKPWHSAIFAVPGVGNISIVQDNLGAVLALFEAPN